MQKVVVWGSPTQPYTITVSTEPVVRVHISHFVGPADYLATLAMVDCIADAMLCLSIPCEIEQERSDR